MTEEQVFLAVLDLPDRTNRTAYLDEACGDNGALRRQVEELLAAHERSGQFLDEPAAEQIAAGQDQTVALHTEGADAMADNKKTSPAPSDDDADDLQFLSPSTRPDSFGRLGHYEMLQVLGHGGFGIVFRAFDDMLQRVVAVKVMAPQLAATSPARRRFLREAQSSAKVRHENVVQVYEVGEQPLPYLVMEFVPGETLQQKLDRCGPLDVPETLRIGRQIAEGLAAAHACDLIHRDIKPGNILLEGEPGCVSAGSSRVKITDFGLARAADDASISQSGIIAGTPMFMAPEQALGHHIDQRADLFSLGSVLYQMASGRPPFRAPSALAVLKRVAEETPRPIAEIIPETPTWLCGIIAKLHAKNPADRYQSAREVADLLADCEAKLKAKQEVKNVLTAEKRGEGGGARGGRKWVAAAALLLLPVIALAVTEFSGVTHLLRRQTTTDPIKPGGDPTPPIQVAKKETADDDGWVQLRKFEGDNTEIWSLALSPDGSRALSGHRNGQVILWDVATGTILKRLKGHTGGAAECVVFGPDGAWALSGGGDKLIRVWDLKTGEERDRIGDFPVSISSLAMFRNGKRALVGSVSPRLLALEPINLTEFESPTKKWDAIAVALSPDQKFALSGGLSNTIWLWEVETGKLIRTFKPGHQQQIRSLAFSPDGTSALSSSADGTCRIWDVASGEEKMVFTGHGQKLRKAMFMPDGRHVVSVGYDTFARIWDSRTGKEIHAIPLPAPGRALALSADGRLLLTGCAEWGAPMKGGDFAIRAWRLPAMPANSPEAPRTFKNSIGMEFVIVPKGKFLMGGSGGNPGTKEVIIPHDFYLGQYEVTQWEWMQVMKNNPSRFKPPPPPEPSSEEERGKLTLDELRKLKENEERDKENYLKSHPVEKVSWEDCQEFIQRLNEKEKPVGWVYSLPSEGEWEYACRGGGDRPVLEYGFDYYFEQPTNLLLPEMANFEDSGKNRTCKVGSYKANRLGLFDLHGNVWEWCRDEVPGDPKDPKAASRRVRRGGSWNTDCGACRAVDRHAYPPSHRDPTLGLRLARVPSGAASPEAKTPTAAAPFTDADVQRIAALPAAEQVEEVRKELMRRNPGFDGDVKHKIEDGVVTEFRIVTDQVTDIAPIRVWNALRVLECGGTWTNGPNGLLADLTSLHGMAALTHVNLLQTKVTDAGIAYLKSCKDLRYLNLNNTRVTDKGLAHLKGCQALAILDVSATKVTDEGLAHFKDCRGLTHLLLGGTKVSDAGLANFKGMPLILLWIDNTGIADLSPLQGMPLEEIRLTPKNITKGLDILRDMKSLKTIGISFETDKAWPAAEFWERYDKGEFGKAAAPFTNADVQRIAALPATEQVEEVRKELMRRNPGFDDKFKHKIEGGVVTEFWIVTDQVTDIAPIRVWNALRVLDCRGGFTDHKPTGLLADLTPLEGMNLAGVTWLNLARTQMSDKGLAHFKDCKNLTHLELQFTRVSDAGLVHFQDCKALVNLSLGATKVSDVGLAHFMDCKSLTHLNLGATKVTDAALIYFKDCKTLNVLDLVGTKVSDAGLVHFKGMPLKRLLINSTAITDLTPLQGMPLEEIRLTPKNITRGLDILRDMKSLKTIGIKPDQAWPAAEFWERYDKGEFKE